MSTMIYLSEPVTTRTRRRCFRIEIENPNTGNKRLAYHQQDLTEDSNEVEISIKQASSLFFDVNNIATDVIEITDPITKATTSISGAAIALWLEAHYVIKAQQNLADIEAKAKADAEAAEQAALEQAAAEQLALEQAANQVTEPTEPIP